MQVIELEELEFEAKVLNVKGIIYVDFFATWCYPCKKLLEKLEASEENRTVYKIDVEKCSKLAVYYNITSLPTIITFEDGRIVNRSTFEDFMQGMIN